MDFTAIDRAQKLAEFFDRALRDKYRFRSAADGIRFVESLCAQPNPSESIERLLASNVGLDRLAEAIRLDLTEPAIRGNLRLLRYLQDPKIALLSNGGFLLAVVDRIVKPPTFWSRLCGLHKQGGLASNDLQPFAWLLLYLLEHEQDLRLDQSEIAEQVLDGLLNAPATDTRVLAHRIDALLRPSGDHTLPRSDYLTPGGRHGNDLADYQQIKIMPPPDELTCSEAPCLWPASLLQDVCLERRPRMHADNQFRLLREDMLSQLKEEIDCIKDMGAKRRTRGFRIDSLALEGVDCGNEKFRKKLGLVLECTRDIPELRSLTARKRADFVIKERMRFLRHQSLGCLISPEVGIVAFATLNRDESRLQKVPARIVLQIGDGSDLERVLTACKSSTSLSFIQINTSVFAYDPILRCLQQELNQDLIRALVTSGEAQGETLESSSFDEVIQALTEAPETDLRDLIHLTKPTILDESQVDSFVNGLQRQISLIQGPPGKRSVVVGARRVPR